MKQSLHTRLDKLLQQTKEAEAKDDDSRPRSEEEKRRGFIEFLAKENPTVFGADDPRSNRTHLEGLTLHELCGVFGAMMYKRVEASLAKPPPHLLAFQELPIADRIRLLMNEGERRRWFARWNLGV